MQLPGRLGQATLGDILGRLHRGRATGTLELVERTGVRAGRSHRLHLDCGMVRQVDTSLPVARVGDILHEAGFIGDDAVRWLARRLVEDPARRAGEILLGQRLVSPGQLYAALRHQLRARLDAIFSLGDATVRFHVAGPRRPDDAPAVPLSPREFLHGRPRARDRNAPPRPQAEPARPVDEARSRRRRALTLLGLSEPADRQAVQRAFRTIAARLHPDRHPGADPRQMATLMKGFAEITAAYHELVA